MTNRRPGPLERIEESGLIAVLRGIGREHAAPVVDALIAAGVGAIEFTADSAEALELVETHRARVGDRSAIGVGTVLDEATAGDAIAAGASFVVTPAVDIAVIERCVSADVSVIAGAYTPTEAVRASNAGADMVKVFPASTGGPTHVAAFQGPLGQLALVPTGGVTVETAGDYIAAGATAVGVGSGLFPDGALEDERYDAIATRAERTLDAVRSAR